MRQSDITDVNIYAHTTIYTVISRKQFIIFMHTIVFCILSQHDTQPHSLLTSLHIKHPEASTEHAIISIGMIIGVEVETTKLYLQC